MMSNTLKSCPCGKTPSKLLLFPQSGCKYAMASGDCCNSWFVEFNTGYYELDSDECMDLAAEDWNNTGRAE